MLIKNMFNQPYLFGPAAYFNQNFSELPTNQKGTYDASSILDIVVADPIQVVDSSIDRVLRLVTFDYQPYLFMNRNETGFTTHGPLFAFTTELAKYLNYT